MAEGCLTREELPKVRRFAKIKMMLYDLAEGEFKQRKRDYIGWGRR